MRVVVAPNSFKEACSSRVAADAIARGWRSSRPDDEIREVILADGGEGLMDALMQQWQCEPLDYRVTGPLGEPVMAALACNRQRGVALLEMASASGLALVPIERRDPRITTTRGTGELILRALDSGARRIVVGAGGSATNDGGAGAVSALGVRFLDRAGKELPPGGAALSRLARIDASQRTPRLSNCEIIVACDVNNPLCGMHGATHVYAPQKGADEQCVEQLEQALEHYAHLVESCTGIPIRDTPMAGAAGGLAAGLLAFAGARLQSGFDIVAEACDLRGTLKDSDLVLTGEGCLDAQSLSGKTVGRLAALASQAGVPIIAFAGKLALGEQEWRNQGLMHAVCISNDEPNLPAAMRATAANLERAACVIAQDWKSPNA